MKQQNYSCLLYSKRILLVAAAALTATIGTFTVTSSVNADDQVPVVAVQQATASSAMQDVNAGSSISNVKNDSQSQDIQVTAQQSVAGANNKSVKSSAPTTKGLVQNPVSHKWSYYNDAGQKVVGTGNTAGTLAYRNVNVSRAVLNCCFMAV